MDDVHSARRRRGAPPAGQRLTRDDVITRASQMIATDGLAAFSLRGLSISASWLIVGLLFVLPWLLLIYVIVWLVRRMIGVAAFAYATVPRASTAIGYALVAVTFLWQLVGSVLTAPHWLLDATPFAHVGLVPAQPFRTRAALIMVVIGSTTAIAAIQTFRQRDLVGS